MRAPRGPAHRRGPSPPGRRGRAHSTRSRAACRGPAPRGGDRRPPRSGRHPGRPRAGESGRQRGALAARDSQRGERALARAGRKRRRARVARLTARPPARAQSAGTAASKHAGRACTSDSSPPSRRTSSRATARPTPPLADDMPRSNNSAARAGGTPGPSSPTRRSAHPRAAVPHTVVAPAPWRSALSSSTSTAWRAASGASRAPTPCGGRAVRGRPAAANRGAHSSATWSATTRARSAGAAAPGARPRASASRCSIVPTSRSTWPSAASASAVAASVVASARSSSRRMRRPASGGRSWCEALSLNSRSRRRASSTRRSASTSAAPIASSSAMPDGCASTLTPGSATRPTRAARRSIGAASRRPWPSARPTAVPTATSESTMTASQPPPTSSVRSVAGARAVTLRAPARAADARIGCAPTSAPAAIRRRSGSTTSSRSPGRAAARTAAASTGSPARRRRPSATAAASASRSSRASARWRSSRVPTSPSGTPSTSTATSAIRPVESSSRRRTGSAVLEAEPDAAYGAQHGRVAELAPQPADVGVERLRRAPPVLVPDRRHDLVARDRLPGAADEQREEVELLRRELELAAVAPRPARARVDPHPGDLALAAAVPAAAQQRPHTRAQHRQRERLRQVVVGARVEPGHLVELGAARREHEDLQPRAAVARAAAHLDAVDVRQAEVEDEQVDTAGLDAVERRGARGDVLDVVPLTGQGAHERLADRGIVFDDQEAGHGREGTERAVPENRPGLPNLGVFRAGAWTGGGNHGCMTSPTTRKLAAALLAANGIIHLILSPEYLSEQTYIGALFVAGGLFLCGLAVALWRVDNVPSWLLGALTMAGMGISFVLSRTTRLPGLKVSEWELSGIVTPLLEAGFIAIGIPALMPRRETAVAPAAADETRFRREREPARRRDRVSA